jgi:predicted small secreted protein
MGSKWIVFVVLGLSLCLQGCETFKGAKDGFKKDWKNMQKADDWMRENMW